MVKRVKGLVNWADKFFASQVSMAAVYAKEWESQKGDFDGLTAEKEEELKVAQERLDEILADTSGRDITTQQEIINDDINRIKEDIVDIKSREEKGKKMVEEYKTQAEAAKLMMFNSANVLQPLLNAFETIEAQSLKMRVDTRLIQTEIIIK